MQDRYQHGRAAELIGTTKNSINRWEKRARAAQEQQEQGLPVDPKDWIWLDFPMPKRNAHSGHRVFTEEDITRIKAWRARLTTDLVP